MCEIFGQLLLFIQVLISTLFGKYWEKLQCTVKKDYPCRFCILFVTSVEAR